MVELQAPDLVSCFDLGRLRSRDQEGWVNVDALALYVEFVLNKTSPFALRLRGAGDCEHAKRVHASDVPFIEVRSCEQL